MSLLKLFRKVSEMARPKGSKNKPAPAAPTEFNYEDSDALYQHVMSGSSVAATPIRDEADLAVAQYDEPTTLNVEAPPGTLPTYGQKLEFFLVEGKVRLDQDGTTPIVADQRRIVLARNIDEALNKFVRYYSAMSNPVQRYTVVQASGSETIN